MKCGTGRGAAVLALAALLASGGLAAAQGSRGDYERALSLDGRTRDKVDRARVNPHWLPGNVTFWYRVETGPGRRECVLVDAEKGTRVPGFAPPPAEPLPGQADMPRRSTKTGEETALVFANRTAGEVGLFWLDANGQRRGYGRLAPGRERQMNTYAGHVWLVVGAHGDELALVEAREEPGRVEVDGKPLPRGAKKEAPRGVSPDGRWAAFAKNHDIWLRDVSTGREFPLSTDGSADDRYDGDVHWSPDGSRLVAMQIARGQEREIHFIESSPKEQLQPRLHAVDYLKPGDRIARPRPRLFDVTGRRELSLKEELFPNPWAINDVRWSPDGSRFTFLYNQRGHQVLRVVAVGGNDGAARSLLEETSPTFIDYSQKTFFRWLDSTEELIWMSERDGWNHLWLYDARSGAVKNQITRGPWVVREVEHVDAARRQVWFMAGGVRPGQEP